MKTKHDKSYAKELAMKHQKEHGGFASDFVAGYMEAIKQTAAPELLEASLKLIEWQTKYPPNKIYDWGMGKKIENELTEIINLHINAIKKATI